MPRNASRVGRRRTCGSASIHASSSSDSSVSRSRTDSATWRSLRFHHFDHWPRFTVRFRGTANVARKRASACSDAYTSARTISAFWVAAVEHLAQRGPDGLAGPSAMLAVHRLDLRRSVRRQTREDVAADALDPLPQARRRVGLVEQDKATTKSRIDPEGPAVGMGLGGDAVLHHLAGQRADPRVDLQRGLRIGARASPDRRQRIVERDHGASDREDVVERAECARRARNVHPRLGYVFIKQPPDADANTRCRSVRGGAVATCGLDRRSEGDRGCGVPVQLLYGAGTTKAAEIAPIASPVDSPSWRTIAIQGWSAMGM